MRFYKRFLCVLLSAVTIFTALFFGAVFSGASGVGFEELVKTSSDVVRDNEGWYDSVNPNDNGALSVGWLQWHANRALSLVRDVVSADVANAKSILGETFYNEIINTSTSWNTRLLTADETKNLSKLLDTEAGHIEQDELAYNDISVYITHGMSLGITDQVALVYFADIENQCGAGGSNQVAKLAAEMAGGYEKITLDILHEASLEDSRAGKFPVRRNKTYNACMLLGWTPVSGEHEIWVADSGVNVRSGPGTTFTKLTTLSKGAKLIITAKRYTNGDTWGKTFVGWVTLDLCTRESGNVPSPAVFNVNGGDSLGTEIKYNISYLNEGRGANSLAVFNSSYGSNSTTNPYGGEARIDANGKVVTAAFYGSHNSSIPAGGFVLSGHGDGFAWLSANVKVGDYVYFDEHTMTVAVFKTQNQYEAATKFVYSGKEVGKLPAPTRLGFVFEGWYTKAEGGERVSGATVSDAKLSLVLYAHWRAGDEAFATYDTNGGVIDGITYTQFNGVNIYRDTNYLVVYKDMTNANTNQYGTEAVVNSEGLVLSVLDAGASAIPEGGFVLSGHDKSSRWIWENIDVGDYVAYNADTKQVSVYDNKDTYLALNKPVTVGGYIGKLPSVSRPYYNFLGWYTEDGEPATETTILTVSGMVITARWELAPSKITFDAAGGILTGELAKTDISGTNTMRGANQLVLYKGVANATTNPYGTEAVISYDGYVCSVEYGVGSAAVPDGGMVLSGHGTMSDWIRNNLKVGRFVSFENNAVSVFEEVGNKDCVGGRTVLYGTAYGELPLISREGYEFAGWADPNGKIVTKTDNINIYGDYTLIAQWKPYHMVSFDLMGGQFVNDSFTKNVRGINIGRGANMLIAYIGKPSSGTNPYGTEAIIGSDGIVRRITSTGNNAMEKGSWILSGHGGGAKWILNNLSVGNYVELYGETLTIYSSIYEYKLSRGNNVSLVDGTTLSMLPEVYKENATFKGWYANGEAVGSDSAVAGGTNYVAMWKQSEATAVFDLDGGYLYGEIAKANVKGYNTGRGSDTLVVYRNIYSTNTNPYGAEAVVSNTGLVLSVGGYGTGNTVIPEGCSVVSGHGSMMNWIVNNLVPGRYVSIEGASIKVYNSRSDYLALNGNAILTVGKPYGTLPIAYKEGFVFAGWKNFLGELVESDTIVENCDNPTMTAIWGKETLLTLDADGGVLPSGAVMNVDSVNTFRGANKAVMYIGKGTTGTNMYGTEVVVEENGRVSAVYVGSGNHAVPEGGYVISAHGSAADRLRKCAHVGSVAVIRNNSVLFYNSVADMDLDDGIISVLWGESIGKLPEPVKEAKEFAGWYFGDEIVTENTVFEADAVLTARYREPQVHINFDFAGGSVIKHQIAATSKNAVRGANELVIYDTGASTTQNEHGTEAAVGADGIVLSVAYRGDTAIPEGGFVLSGHGDMSQWLGSNVRAGSYVVLSDLQVTVYNSVADSFESGKTIIMGDAFGILPTPVMEGYSFEGWYLGDTLITAETVSEVYGNIILTARWEKLKTELVFDTGDGYIDTVRAAVEVNGFNTVRGGNQLIVYNNSQTTGTNPYGREVAVDANGTVLSIGYRGNTEIPVGGFVLSGHDSMATWLLENVKAGNYIALDNKLVKVYMAKGNSLVVNNKVKVVRGEAFGALPVPVAPEGMSFAGWYDTDGNLVTDATVAAAASYLLTAKYEALAE